MSELVFYPSSIPSSINLFIVCSICLYIHLVIHPSIHPSVHLAHHSIHPSAHSFALLVHIKQILWPTFVVLGNAQMSKTLQLWNSHKFWRYNKGTVFCTCNSGCKTLQLGTSSWQYLRIPAKLPWRYLKIIGRNGIVKSLATTLCFFFFLTRGLLIAFFLDLYLISDF